MGSTLWWHKWEKQYSLLFIFFFIALLLPYVILMSWKVFSPQSDSKLLVQFLLKKEYLTKEGPHMHRIHRLLAWNPQGVLSTSFPVSLILPPPGARGRYGERHWERGWGFILLGVSTIYEQSTFNVIYLLTCVSRFLQKYCTCSNVNMVLLCKLNFCVLEWPSYVCLAELKVLQSRFKKKLVVHHL